MRKFIALKLFLVRKPLLACSLSRIDITRLARDFARFVDFEIEERSNHFIRSLEIKSGDSSIRQETTRRTHSSLLRSLQCAICLSDEYPPPSLMSQRSRWQSRTPALLAPREMALTDGASYEHAPG